MEEVRDIYLLLVLLATTKLLFAQVTHPVVTQRSLKGQSTSLVATAAAAAEPSDGLGRNAGYRQTDDVDD